MTTNNKVRIVKKEKDGITLRFDNLGTKKASWEEFNKMYEFCPDTNNLYCTLKPEWQEKMKKAGELLDSALIHYLQIDWKIANPDPNVVPDLVKVSMVGSYVEEISKLLECPYIDAYRLLNDRALEVRKALGGPSSFRGLWANKIQKQKPKQRISTNKMSDINPNLEKLKEQFEKNEQGSK